MININAVRGLEMLSKKAKTRKQKKAEKKQKGSFFRFMYKTFFNVPAWIGIKQIKDSNRVIVKYVKDAFTADQAVREETFEESLKRQEISEEQLKETYKSNARNFYIMLALIILLAAYGVYLLFTASFKGFFVDLAVIVFASVRAFQFSFWNFQIKHRKLGCTAREWLAGKVS